MSYHIIIAQFIIYIKEKRKVMFQSIYNNNVWLGITNDEGLVLVSIYTGNPLITNYRFLHTNKLNL